MNPTSVGLIEWHCLSTVLCLTPMNGYVGLQPSPFNPCRNAAGRGAEPEWAVAAQPGFVPGAAKRGGKATVPEAVVRNHREGEGRAACWGTWWCSPGQEHGTEQALAEDTALPALSRPWQVTDPPCWGGPWGSCKCCRLCASTGKYKSSSAASLHALSDVCVMGECDFWQRYGECRPSFHIFCSFKY